MDIGEVWLVFWVCLGTEVVGLENGMVWVLAWVWLSGVVCACLIIVWFCLVNDGVWVCLRDGVVWILNGVVWAWLITCVVRDWLGIVGCVGLAWVLAGLVTLLRRSWRISETISIGP